MSRTWMLGLTSALIGLIVALGLAEIALRVVGNPTQMLYRPDPYFGWGHTPGDSFQRVTNGRSVEIQINSLGLRSPETAYEKKPGTMRVLVLGDSFTEAFQVPAESIYPSRIEQLLNTRNAREYEVINAGVAGYGTDNALLFYRHEGYKYDADVVLLSLYVGNDIRNNWYRLDTIDSGGLRKPYFSPGPDGLELNMYPFDRHSSLTTRIKIFLNRNVRLYSFARELRDRLRSREIPAGRGDDGAPPTVPLDMQLFDSSVNENWEIAWSVTEQLIGMLRDEVEAAGQRFVVALIPTKAQVHRHYWQAFLADMEGLDLSDFRLDWPTERLRRILESRGIEFIDLAPAFREQAAAADSELYIPDDGHWNEAGHDIAAATIAGYLNRAGD